MKEPLPDRQPIELTWQMETAIRAWWGCQRENWCCGGKPTNIQAYTEAGVDYIEANCLTCGEVTRYPRSEWP